MSLVVALSAFYLLTGIVPTPDNLKEYYRRANLGRATKQEISYATPEFEFNPKRITTVAPEVSPATSTKDIYLHIDENNYFVVRVPEDLPIITDYNKYVYSLDNTVGIMVTSGISQVAALSKEACVRDAISLTPLLVRSNPGTKGEQVAARYLVNDKAVVVRTYDNPVAFATVLKSFSDNEVKTILTRRLDTDKKTVLLSSLREGGEGYTYSVNFNPVEDIQKSFIYPSGMLSLSREFKLFDNTVESLCTRASIVSGKTVADKLLSTDKVYYAELGDWTICAMYLNYNTTLAWFGVGPEARYNILYYMAREGVYEKRSVSSGETDR